LLMFGVGLQRHRGRARSVAPAPGNHPYARQDRGWSAGR
jgi:hypothetical protein